MWLPSDEPCTVPVPAVKPTKVPSPEKLAVVPPDNAPLIESVVTPDRAPPIARVVTPDNPPLMASAPFTVALVGP